MAPKRKAQKVALSDFLADVTVGGSWADEMDALPSAPAPRDPNAEPSGLGGSHLSRGNRYGDRGDDTGGFGRGGRGGFGDREDRPMRAELPVPDRPPFNAYVGNLSFDIVSTDLEKYFGGQEKVISVRMISDSITGKSKGYGYVEFADRDSLVAALDKSGRDLGGRTVRVSVAEPPHGGKDGEDRTAGAWRREGPLPPLDDRRRPSSGAFRDRDPISDADRGERMGFGSKFVPSPDTERGYRRSERQSSYGGFSGASTDEDRGERMGFGSKFTPSAEDRPERRVYSDREPPQRGSAFVPTPDGPPSRHGFGSERKVSEPSGAADMSGSWRSSRPPLSRNSSASPAESPVPQRRKLELTPRTVPTSGTPESATSPASSKPSPFGAARPVDSADRERAIAEKLAKEHEERAAKIEAEKKAKAEAEETRKTARHTAPNPFGAAKPVDTLKKDLEIGDKLEQERKEMGERLARARSGAPPPPSGPTRRPTGETGRVWGASQPGSPRSAEAGSKPNGSGQQSRSPPPPSEPKSPKFTHTSLRKEGLSFAELARAKANNASTPRVDEVEKQVAGLEVK